ncbi:expressed unknown protein [Seminavis robusta]|uniref:Uncharacterized protein n=1 Tax=Seminavis robusta TaxID=568900 RepID=A0A9N8DAX2_9STRA|nr:expressed unknown protein [Seminavis robusta]|eukprot:Sro38_g023810.1 n/a (221) ;mRNA; f:103813-104841
MRFSAAVLVALLSLSSSSDTAHAKKFQFPLHAVLPSRRLARARNVGGVPSAIHKDDSQSSLRRAALPLWETEEQLVQSRPLWATDEEAKKPCSGKEDVDLGILACGDGFSCSSEGMRSMVLNCPGIPLVDLCEEGLAEEELLDILLELDECVDGGTNVADLTNQPDETEAPTMGGTPMGTSGATVVDTMVQTGVEPEVGEEDEGEDSTAVEAAEAEVATP